MIGDTVGIFYTPADRARSMMVNIIAWWWQAQVSWGAVTWKWIWLPSSVGWGIEIIIENTCRGVVRWKKCSTLEIEWTWIKKIDRTHCALLCTHNGSGHLFVLFFCLFVFYGISTFIVYLMPNPFSYKWTILFKIIQLSISTQFKSQKHFYFKLFSLVKQF